MKTTKFTGTCQGCFATHSLIGGVLVHHGYRRPGVGYIIGDCAGVGHQPYEISCELTKSFHKHLEEKVLPNVVAHLGRLEAGPVEISIEITDYSKPRSNPRIFSSHPTRRVAIDRNTPSPDSNCNFWVSGNDFDRHLENSIAKVKRDIEHVTQDIATLAKRITDWVYAPEKLVAYEGAKKQAVVHLANAVKSGRAVCNIRLRNAKTTANHDEVTCTRCKK
jgi:hypothetical protein